MSASMRRDSPRKSSLNCFPKLFGWLSRSSNTDMSKFTLSEIKELASCLRFRVDSPGADCARVRYSIDHVPHHLRASRMTNLFATAGLVKKLCSVHEDLDPNPVSSIFDSLRAEVVDSVQSLRQYAYLLGPDENMALDRTAGIEGMWKESVEKDRAKHSMRWKYQVDQCQACMLSRVASKPAVLRELRTLILAKTATASSNEKGSHGSVALNSPLILLFINEWIMLTDQKDELFYLSGQRAAVIKDAKNEWSEMKARMESHGTQQQPVASNKPFILTQSMPEKSKLRHSVRSLSTSSLTRATTTPSHSSSLSRPPSRSAYEFAEIDAILQSYVHDVETDPFRPPPPGENYSSSTVSNRSHGDSSMTTMSSMQNEGDGSHHLHPGSALSYYTHVPGSSTEGLHDLRSQFSVTPDSTVDTLTSFAIYPEFHELHGSPEYEARFSNALTIPPLRSHSPFAVPHLVPSRRPSMASRYCSVSSNGQNRWAPDPR